MLRFAEVPLPGVFLRAVAPFGAAIELRRALRCFADMPCFFLRSSCLRRRARTSFSFFVSLDFAFGRQLPCSFAFLPGTGS